MKSRLWSGLGAGLALSLALLVTPAVADDAKTKSVKVAELGLSLDVPENWTEKPANMFRKAQLEIPAAEGDTEPAELVVFHFGRAGGGGVQANIDRWASQFENEGRKMTVYEGESKEGAYTLVDLKGTWNKPIGPPIAMKKVKMPGATMLAVILHTEKSGDVFIRLTGPEKTVAAAGEAFRKSFGADPKKEVERKAAEDKTKGKE